MIIIQYNSNNSLTPELKWASFEKRNNLDELINIPTKAEERPMIQISFRTQDPNIKAGTIRNPRQNLQLIHDPLCFQNPRIHPFDLPQKCTIRALFKAKSVDAKAYSTPSLIIIIRRRAWNKNEP